MIVERIFSQVDFSFFVVDEIFVNPEELNDSKSTRQRKYSEEIEVDR
jgi:hypothetical protein